MAVPFTHLSRANRHDQLVIGFLFRAWIFRKVIGWVTGRNRQNQR
jgi:hypothetical protein